MNQKQNFFLEPKISQNHKKEAMGLWLSKNNRIKVESEENGIEFINICSKSVLIKKNGNGFDSRVRIGEKKIISLGQEVMIEGRVFKVAMSYFDIC